MHGDLQVELACRERDEDIVGVVRHRGDERGGALDPGLTQHGVLERRADHVQAPRGLEVGLQRGIGIDHHHRHAGLLELFDDDLSKAPEAAHDHVTFQRPNRAIHAPPPERLAQAPLDQVLGDVHRGVEGGSDADEDEADRVDAARRAARSHLLVAHRGERDDRHVEGLEEAEPLHQHEAQCADQREREEGPERRHGAPAVRRVARPDPRGVIPNGPAHEAPPAR